MVETIFLALMGTFFALLVSVPLSFLGARNLMQGSRAGWIVYSLVRTIYCVKNETHGPSAWPTISRSSCSAPPRRANRP